MTAKKPTEHDERWVAGHDAGYAKGRDDGIGIGYADAKLRAFRAVAAVEESTTYKTAVREVQDALAQTLGRPS